MRHMMGAQPLETDHPRRPLSRPHHSISQGETGRGFPGGLLRWGSLALFLAFSLSGTFANTSAQEAPVPTLETLAEGPAPTAIGESVAWRLVRDTAEPEGQAGDEVRAAGFGIPEADPILTTNVDTDEVREFAPGEAFYAAEDSTTRRESVTDQAVPYSRIALV